MTVTIVKSLRVIALKALSKKLDEEFDQAVADLIRAMIVYFFAPIEMGASENDAAEIISAANDVMAAFGQPVEMSGFLDNVAARGLLKKVIETLKEHAADIDWAKIILLLLSA